MEKYNTISNSYEEGIAAMVTMARQAGTEPAYAQGGGGNVSCKLDGTRMAVKASGAALSGMTGTQGWVSVDYALLRARLPNLSTDDGYAELLTQSMAAPGLRPSLETGFHALLGRAVLHTHSVYANVLCCAAEGQALAQKLLPEAAWVGYATPGLALFQAIAAGDARAKSIILLASHGIIVQANTAEEALRLHRQANRRIIEHFQLPLFKQPARTGADDASQMLFPDQAVFRASPALQRSQAGQETHAAARYVEAQLKRCNLTSNYLPASEAAALLSMEAERHRQRTALS